MAERRGCYAGKLLFVDLSNKRWEARALSDDMARKYLGGAGFGAALAPGMIPRGADPLAPENAIFIAAGALTGTESPGSPKTAILSKSPLTGTLGLAHAGDFGAELKWAGYDGLIIAGRSERPCYLKIFDDDIEICEAGELWGRDTYETAEALWSRYQPRETTVAAIGQAGENLVSFSLALINKTSTWGRGGFGAVMGSKKLKAIVVHGTKGVPIADSKNFKRLLKRTLESFEMDQGRQLWTDVGTMVSWETYARIGNLRYDNWSKQYPVEEAISRFGIDAYRKQLKKRTLACPSCIMGCKAELEVKEGEFAGLNTNTSCNLVGTMFYGAVCGAEDYNRVARLHDMANRWGLDNISMGNFFTYIVDLFEKGVIPSGHLDGRHLKRGYESAAWMLESIAFRRGIGDLMASGWRGMAERYGKAAQERSVHVRGMDCSFEPRSNLGTENLSVWTNPRGGHATVGLSITVVPGRRPEQLEKYCRLIGVPEEKIAEVVSPSAPGRYPGVNVGKLLKYVEDLNTALAALGVCSRPPINRLYPRGAAEEYYRAATGVELEEGGLLKAGERIFTAMTLFNIREGFTRENLEFPKVWLDQDIHLEDGYFRALEKEMLDALLDDYYREREWDEKRGCPTPAKVAELGLDLSLISPG